MTNHTNPNRRPAGTPAGGQFAPTGRAESQASLADGGSSPFEFTADEADAWRSAGFGKAEARAWRVFTDPDGMIGPGEAKQWANAGFTVPAAAAWRSAQFTPGEAQQWANAGFVPFGDGTVDASKWRAAQFDADQASRWRAAGFSWRGSARWVKAGCGYFTAAAWSRSGIGPVEAGQMIASGKISPDAGW